MRKLLVYSHDTYGLGNLRRMLSICRHLGESLPELSILLVSGSPMVHSFRLSPGLDYIKLPCLTRTDREGYAVKSLGLGLAETIQLRSDLILSAAANFRPDLLLVDKKPSGVKNELDATLRHLRERLPATKLALVLRDILDAPEATVGVWERHGYHEVIRDFYDLVLVLGVPEVFDPVKEYRFPEAVADKVRFCGYLRRPPGRRGRAEIRAEIGLTEMQRLVVLTTGGGADGYALLSTYLEGLAESPPGGGLHSRLICGPEMGGRELGQLSRLAEGRGDVSLREFTDDLMSYLGAADVVVSMAGYNTVCEILSLRKRAVVVPRVRPVPEQWMRAERMSRLGLFKVVHPDGLTPQELMRALRTELERDDAEPQLDLDAHPRLARWVSSLLPA
jgi:predicted glycosyltransferase